MCTYRHRKSQHGGQVFGRPKPGLRLNPIKYVPVSPKILCEPVTFGENWSKISTKWSASKKRPLTAMASRKRYRYTFEVVFATEELKASFAERVESTRRDLESREGVRLNNFELLSRLMETAEAGTNARDATAREERSERLINAGAAVLDVSSE